MVFLCFSECCHGNICNLNVIVLLEFNSTDLYLLFAIFFSSKFQNSIFYQHMRPKSGLKSPRPYKSHSIFHEPYHEKTKIQIRFALTIQLVTAFDVCFMDSTIHRLASSISSLTVQTAMCPGNRYRQDFASSVQIVSKILKYNEMLTDIWRAVSVVKFEPNCMESLPIKYKIRDCRIVKLNWWYRL